MCALQGFVMQRVHLEVSVDYHQFYLMDAVANPPAPTEWSEEDIRNRAKVAPHIIVVCPVRDFTVPVTIEVHDVPPKVELDAWQHVVECSIALPSGQCSVEECMGPSRHLIPVAPGDYRALLLYAGLNTLSEDEFEGGDHYIILLWQASPCPLRVLKHWEEQEIT